MNHVTVTIGRRTLLSLARGEAVYEVDCDRVVTLIHASDYPRARILEMLGNDPARRGDGDVVGEDQ